MFRKYIIIFILAQITFPMLAQKEGRGRMTDENQERGKDKKRETNGPSRIKKDSIVTRIDAWSMNQMGLVTDNTLTDTVQRNVHLQYRHVRYDYSSSVLGNVGLPSQANMFSKRIFNNDFVFSTPHQTENFALSNAIYFNVTKPYTTIYHSTGGRRLNEQVLEIIHTQNINPFLNYTLQFNVNSSKGQYQNQQTSNKHFIFSVNYTHKHYRGHYTYLANRNKQEENGGLFEDNVDYPTKTLPVFMANTNSKYQTNEGRIVNEFALQAFRNDSLLLIRNRLSAEVVSSYKGEFRKYTDATVPEGIYENAYVNALVSNDSVHYRTLNNRVSLKFAHKDEKLILKLGGAYSYHEYFNFHEFLIQNFDTAYTNRWLVASANAELAGINATFGLQQAIAGHNSGDIHTKLLLKYTLPLNLGVEARLEYYKRTPGVFWQHYSSNRIKWQNDFDKETRKFAELAITAFNKKIKVGTQVTQTDSLLFFANNKKPAQWDRAVKVPAVFIESYLEYSLFFTRLNAYYQALPTYWPIHVPEFAAMASFGLHYNFVGIANASMGVDVYYNKPYFMPAYFPATGMFHLQYTEFSTNYPMADFVLSADISTATAFIKLENLSELFITDNSELPTNKYYSTFGYPYDLFTFKYGIRWKFNN